VTEGDRVVAEFPGSRLVTDCPTYTPPARESEAIVALRRRDVAAIAELPDEHDPVWTLERLLSSPTLASKAWVYRQYDSTVRTNTVVGPGSDAAVLRVRGTQKALALKTDGNGRYAYLEPRVGGRIAVAEAARNVACTGARPLAITNNLNFGNPRRPEVYYQLREVIAGMAEACRALGTPVTGGNVSLYNESPTGAIYPTPVVGMVGLIESLSHVTRAPFTHDGDSIVLLGEPSEELGGSEYLYRVHGVAAGAPPRCDLAAEQRLIDALLDAIRSAYVRSAHDVSDGGLAVSLAECAVLRRGRTIGAEVDLSAWSALPLRALLFGEAQGRVIVSTPRPVDLLAVAERFRVPARAVGHVRGGSESLEIVVGARHILAPVSRLARAYHDTIPALMAQAAAATTAAGLESPVS
jgi:phosphoribosylformylglycinamidine synthase subunit PurL